MWQLQYACQFPMRIMTVGTIGGGDGGVGAWPPTFCWTMLARKDRDTLIEQSATLIEQSTAISLKTVDSYSSNIVKKCLNYTLRASKM